MEAELSCLSDPTSETETKLPALVHVGGGWLPQALDEGECRQVPRFESRHHGPSESVKATVRYIGLQRAMGCTLSRNAEFSGSFRH
jgi:hypothetical protein